MIDLLKRNWAAKIIALIVAIVLWFFVMNEQNPAVDSSVTVPLELSNLSEGYTVEHSVDTVKLKVRGQRSLFIGATESDFKAYIDLTGITEGKHPLKVQTTLPRGFDLIAASPETIIFDVDKIVKSDFKVELAFSGSPDTGVTVGAAEPLVKSVRIEGPSMAVGAVSRVVGYVSLGGKSSDFTAPVPLVAVNKEGKEVGDIKMTPDTINVQVSIVKGLYKKFVDIKPMAANDLPEGLVLGSITVEPAKIDIFGDQRVVDTLEFVETEPFSLADVTKSTAKEVRLKLPIGITVTNDTILVKIEIAGQDAEKGEIP